MDSGTIADDGRIRAALPTIQKLLELGASVLICSHLGRPEGMINKEFTLAPVAAKLGELLGQKVVFANDTVGEEAKTVADALAPGEVAVLENLRFEDSETSKNPDIRKAFASELAALADGFVSDGFGVVHRKHSSVYELATLLPSAAGLLVEAEVRVLEQLTGSDQRPYTVVLGGSKVSDKLAVIGSLLPKIDNLVVGGGMLFTFLAAKGLEVASSLLERDQIDTVRQYISQAESLGVRITLPTEEQQQLPASARLAPVAATAPAAAVPVAVAPPAAQPVSSRLRSAAALSVGILDAGGADAFAICVLDFDALTLDLASLHPSPLQEPPRIMAAAARISEAAEWLSAATDEIKAKLANNTYELVPRPPGRKSSRQSSSSRAK
jgi:3-phosphoglycerate kinase